MGDSVLFKRVVLHCHQKIGADRTINNIYHLLTGRRSVQTVQDSHLYQLQTFHGIYRHLTKVDFHRLIQELKRDGYIKSVGQNEHTFIPTDKADLCLNGTRTNDDLLMTYFSGSEYYRMDESFYNRLLLFIQVVTNQKMNNYSYIPVVDDNETTQWLKRNFQQINRQLDRYITELHKELAHILNHLRDEHASIFVDQLTSYKLYGLSVSQLARTHHCSKGSIRLTRTAVIHYMLTQVTNNGHLFPVLSSFVPSEVTPSHLSQSATKTYTMLKKHFTLEQIANKRQLKLSTVHDHLVEIAYHVKHFSIDRFVSQADQKIIIKAIEKAETSKLKEIKSIVGDAFDYYQIKLVLSKAHQKEVGDTHGV